MKIEIDVNRDLINKNESFIYTFHLLNQKCKDVTNIVFTPFIMDELSFIGGSIKRQRGMMDIGGGWINLEIGNLAPNEEAVVTIELELDHSCEGKGGNFPLEIKCYGTIIFNNHQNTKQRVISNIIYTKIIDHTL